MSERPLEVSLQNLSSIESWKRLSSRSVVRDVDTRDQSEFDSIGVAASSVHVVLSSEVIEDAGTEVS